MMGIISSTRQGIGSSSLGRAAEPERAMVIVIKSDRDHINMAGLGWTSRGTRGKQAVLFNPNPSRTIHRDVLRPTAEAEQDNYYIVQIHDMTCQCTHAVSEETEITDCRLVYR